MSSCPRRQVLLLLLAGVVLLAPACRRAPAPPAIASGSPRVVALSPGISATLSDMGGAGMLVGRSDSDEWIDPAIPPCGEGWAIDYEALLRAAPTHVLLQRGAQPVPERLSALASEKGWVVRSWPLLTLDDISGCAAELDALFPGATDQAAAERMARAWSRRPGDPDPARAGRVLLLHTASPPQALGPGSYHQQVLERLGGTPAITAGNPYIVLDAEDVVRLAPDAIVFVTPRRAGGKGSEGGEKGRNAGAQALLGSLAGLDIPAVKSGRVAVIDDPRVLIPGTPMVKFADDLAAVLRGWSGGE